MPQKRDARSKNEIGMNLGNKFPPLLICCSAAFGKNDVHTAEKRMLQCSAVSAAQLSENCSATSVFRLWHVVEKAPASYSAVSGPSGPKPQKSQKNKKESPGPSGPRVPKSPKRARKESKPSQKGSFLTLFGLFLDFLGPFDRRARETLFLTRF